MALRLFAFLCPRSAPISPCPLAGRASFGAGGGLAMIKAFAAALVLTAVTATAAHAQPASHLTLGAGIGFQNYRDSQFSTRNPAIVPEYHIGLSSHAHRNGLGWGFAGGIAYYTPDRSEFIG